MKLSDYDNKYVRLETIYGDIFTGMTSHCSADYCYHEYGQDEEALLIEDFIVYASQVAFIAETEPHGTAEIWMEDLMCLRRYRPDDADELYKYLGQDPSAYRYCGRNPYATPDMAHDAVQRVIDSYGEGDDYGAGNHSYNWVIDTEDVVVGTIGTYGYVDGAAGASMADSMAGADSAAGADMAGSADSAAGADMAGSAAGADSAAGTGMADGAAGSSIGVRFAIVEGWRGRGIAAMALRYVLEHLTEHEGIGWLTAWCAAENDAARRAMEKAGMQLVRTEPGGLTVGDKAYDKLFYEYRTRKNI